MATVRDTDKMVALVEGREVIDPKEITFDAWVGILGSVVRVVTPKHLHEFQRAQDILRKPFVFEGIVVRQAQESPPARIWFGRPGSSTEFIWSNQYLGCGVRSTRNVDKEPCASVEYLLFGRDSCFYVLSTRWHQGGDGLYRLSNNTKDGHLRVQARALEEVVKWCCEHERGGAYLLYEVLQSIFDAVEQTETDLSGRLERITLQRKVLAQRLSAISGVRPGHLVWIVGHSHSWDRALNNEYRPVQVMVREVTNGRAHFDNGQSRLLYDCFKTMAECQEHCPEPHADD